MPSQPTVSVYLTPDQIPPRALQGGVAVVVDVLRASTVIVHALASGCEAVIPCGEIEEAREWAAQLPDHKALLVGERDGLPIPGFDLGNSPGEFTREVCQGRTLIMTTTNGTRAILASQAAQRILIVAFANLGATAHTLREDGRPMHVICAGTDGRISFEDSALAGALVWELTLKSPSLHLPSATPANDEAEMVLAMWKGLLDEFDQGEPLTSTLSRGRGGQRIRQLGLIVDIRASAQVDFLNRIVEVRRNPLRLVTSQ